MTIVFTYQKVRAKEKMDLVHACRTKSDCMMININCGMPGAINKKYESYIQRSQVCDKSMNYEEMALRYVVACKKGVCTLLPK